MSDETWDGIILGSGHNALVLQAYLGRAGLRVLCLERRDVAGGGLATEEDPRHPGFLHNTHSFFHWAADRMPWYLDLELRRQGAVYVEPELNVVMLRREGASAGVVDRLREHGALLRGGEPPGRRATARVA